MLSSVSNFCIEPVMLSDTNAKPISSVAPRDLKLSLIASNISLRYIDSLSSILSEDSLIWFITAVSVDIYFLDI